MRAVRVLAVAATAFTVAVGTAFAHTEVKSTTPAKGKTVSRNLSTVTVTFTGQIRSGTITVTNSSGKTVSDGKGGRDPRNVKRLRVPLKSGLKAGSYKAKWTMKAADGHTQSGSFSFKLR